MSEEIQKYIKLLHIDCPRCLDMKILWKGRDNVFWARMDGRGDYDIINCDRCSGGGWNRCSLTTEIYAKGMHAFHVNDGEWHVLETLRPLVKPHLEKITEQEEADRIQKEKEDEANPIALWSYYKKDDIKKHIKHSDIQIEVGKIAERIYDAVKLSSGDITELTSLIKELKMDLKSSMESSTCHKTELKQINNSKGRFNVSYVKLQISNQMESSSCDCLEWCGFNTKEAHFSLEYIIYNPRNVAAKIKCDEDMSKHVIL